jgi:predicted pyridoxine 5'-phosphate oxidase superfamily flavin-nucleotide-binding protein
MADMTLPPRLVGWPLASSPFHAGEMAMQAKAGLRERIERQGRRIIRRAMPDQHRELFAKLPYLFLGSLDHHGRPWAAMLWGEPGFAASPDPRHLVIRTAPVPAAPFGAALAAGTPGGLLGLELETRRRNRMNGRIVAVGDGAFTVRVDQSFGNCPQYIQARDIMAVLPCEEPPAARPEGPALSPAATAIITGADTFFIATASARPGDDDAAEGLDVSHRGGRPGFVRIDAVGGDCVLTIPDFRGNNAFNTFGNLAVRPRAGLLFPDFSSGDLLALTGTAEVLWDDPEIAAYAGARRLLRVRVEEGVQLPGAMPFRWMAPEPARELDATGAWA